jgi:hypothetical protein
MIGEYFAPARVVDPGAVHQLAKQRLGWMLDSKGPFGVSVSDSGFLLARSHRSKLALLVLYPRSQNVVIDLVLAAGAPIVDGLKRNDLRHFNFEWRVGVRRSYERTPGDDQGGYPDKHGQSFVF